MCKDDVIEFDMKHTQKYKQKLKDDDQYEIYPSNAFTKASILTS